MYRLLICSAAAMSIAAAQTSGTAIIVGLVTDASGAAIAKASIELLDPSSQHLTGQVAGARADQSAFTLDGIDATDLTAGTNFYVGSATDYNGPTPMIPVPAEGVEEFRLSTTNSNATYGRSAGGQVSLVTRRG